MKTKNMSTDQIEAFIGTSWQKGIEALSKMQTSILILLLANGEALVTHLFGDLAEKLKPLTDRNEHTPEDGQEVMTMIRHISAFAHEQICQEIDRRFPVVS